MAVDVGSVNDVKLEWDGHSDDAQGPPGRRPASPGSERYKCGGVVGAQRVGPCGEDLSSLRQYRPRLLHYVLGRGFALPYTLDWRCCCRGRAELLRDWRGEYRFCRRS
eukprot:gene8202-biopygen4200